MAEYIDRDEAIKHITSKYDECLSVGDVIEELDAIPAADVVPVVRCKDCRHRDPEDKKCDSGQTERQGCPFKVADDYFCAYGER